MPQYYQVIKNPMDLGTIKGEPISSCLAVWQGWLQAERVAVGVLCRYRMHRGDASKHFLRLLRADQPNCSSSKLAAPLRSAPAAAKIDGRRYNNVYEFRDDVRLTFNNCRIFNPPGEQPPPSPLLAAAVVWRVFVGRLGARAPSMPATSEPAVPPALPRSPAAGNHVRIVGDQTSERFEKKWAMSAIEYHWEAHIKQCALEDKVGAGVHQLVSARLAARWRTRWVLAAGGGLGPGSGQRGCGPTAGSRAANRRRRANHWPSRCASDAARSPLSPRPPCGLVPGSAAGAGEQEPAGQAAGGECGAAGAHAQGGCWLLVCFWVLVRSMLLLWYNRCSCTRCVGCRAAA